VKTLFRIGFSLADCGKNISFWARRQEYISLSRRDDELLYLLSKAERMYFPEENKAIRVLAGQIRGYHDALVSLENVARVRGLYKHAAKMGTTSALLGGLMRSGATLRLMKEGQSVFELLLDRLRRMRVEAALVCRTELLELGTLLGLDCESPSDRAIESLDNE
jgi:hypothetical protein